MSEPGPSKKPKLDIQDSTLELPWVEKHRPKTLDDVVGNEETIDRLKTMARDGNMTHMIISGTPGIGKTTSVHCLAHELLGSAYSDAVLELNASDERGIEVVRGRIKTFAQKKVILPAGKQKIIILDEADSMTPGAQQALRRTMEIYAHSTRFVFACNQSSKIIEPLQSRCAIMRFGRLTDEQVFKRLMQIIVAENVEYNQEGISAILFSTEGDMRQAINNLQSTVSGFGFVNAENVNKVIDTPHPKVVKDMILACRKKNLEIALDNLDFLWKKGYSAVDIVSTMFRVSKFFEKSELPETEKLAFIKEIGFTHLRVLEGISTKLQLAGLLARLSSLY